MLSRHHFSSALSVVLCLTGAICILAMAIGWSLSFGAGKASTVAGLVAIFALILFADGPVPTYTAIAPRHRGFKRLALANIGGDLVGSLVGLTLAFFGVGVWSLLSVRLVSRFAMLG